MLDLPGWSVAELLINFKLIVMLAILHWLVEDPGSSCFWYLICYLQNILFIPLFLAFISFTISQLNLF